MAMHGQVWDPKKDGDGLGALLARDLLSHARAHAVCGVCAQAQIFFTHSLRSTAVRFCTRNFRKTVLCFHYLRA
jgi:hypothetical protein